MMKLGVRMENSERMLVGCYIVSQNEVKLIKLAAAAGYRSYRVMRAAGGFGKYKRRFVGISAPGSKYAVGKVNKAVGISTLQSYNRHRPLDNTCRNILKAAENKAAFYRCLCHCKFIISALKMVVAEYRAADNGQIGV